MSAVATAVVGGAVIGAVASDRAADKQAGAAGRATDAELKMYYQSRADQEAWRKGGSVSLNRLGFLLGLDPDGFNKGLSADATDAERAAYNEKIKALKANPLYGSLQRTFAAKDFVKDPGYAFRLSEGMKGVNNSAAARGGLLSGAALKAASRYNQDFASNEFTNVYNRWNNDRTTQFNRLATLAGVGQTAATQLGNQAIATGQAIGNNITAAGNARASGYVGAANAVTGAVGTGVNMWQQNQLMNSLNNSGYSGYVNNANQNGFGAAFTNMADPAYG